MPGADPNTRKHFDFKTETVTDAKAKSKTRTRVDCHYCHLLCALDGGWVIFPSLDRLRCYLTGDEDICKGGVDGKGNGGIGPCPNVSEEISDEVIEIVRTRQGQIQAKLDHGVKGLHWIKLVGYSVFNKRQVGFAHQHEMIADYLDEMRTDVQALRAVCIEGALHEEIASKLELKLGGGGG